MLAQIAGTLLGERAHLPHPVPAPRARPDSRRGRPARVDAVGGDHAHVGRVGCGRRPDRRTPVADRSAWRSSPIGGLGAALSTSYVGLGLFWLLAGVGAASTNSASGRLVVGWFPPQRRGTAMGIRQTALPLGHRAGRVHRAGHGGGTRAADGPAHPGGGVCRDDGHRRRPRRRPTASEPRRRPPRAGSSPTRTGAARVSAASTSRRCCSSSRRSPCGRTCWCGSSTTGSWSTTAAGALVASTQLLGAAARIGVGWWSDRVGSRLGPMRIVAVTTLVTMVALGVLEDTRRRRGGHDRRHGRHGGQQRPGVHRRRRARRSLLVGPGDGRAQHRAVLRGRSGPSAGRSPGDRIGVTRSPSRRWHCSRCWPSRSCRCAESAWATRKLVEEMSHHAGPEVPC